MKLLLAFVALLIALPAAGVTLVRDGQPVAKIYVTGPLVAEPPAPPPPGAKPVKRKPAEPVDPQVRARAEAVRELNYHVKKMSGAELEVVVTDDPASIRPPAIVLGALAAKKGAAVPEALKSDEAFRLVATNDLLLIAGRTDTATLHGVYAFLNHLGCDWVMPGEVGEVIPVRNTIEVASMDKAEQPDFALRSMGYNGGPRIVTAAEVERFDLWKSRQRMTARDQRPSFGAGHAWDAFIKRHKTEFDKDPTMLALRRMPDGTLKRSGPQLEPTHPRVVELWVQDIKDAFAKNNWPKDTAAAFPVGPADGLNYSQSAESTLAGSGRVDPMSGDPDVTDLVVLLANRILEKLGDEYPNVRLGYYCYSTHGDFPARYKPHPRLNVIFAPISYSRVHGFDDQNSKTRPYYRQVVDAWGALAKRQGNLLVYRGYNWNLAENMVPFTQLRMLGADVPVYKQWGFMGSTVEAVNGWAANGPHNYLFAKLHWDAGLKWQDVLREYCGKAFGPGAAAMERYFLRLVETQHAAGQEAGSYHAIHLIFDDGFVAKGEADIAEARKAATDAGDRARIDVAAAGLESLKLYLRYHAATRAFDFKAAQKAYQAMHAHHAALYDANPDLTSKLVPQYLKRFLEDFVSQTVQYSAAPYHIVHKLPDELPTLMDPGTTGIALNYFSPAIADGRFAKTRTYSSTWDAQGLGAYKGAVWYRDRFTLPPTAKGQPVGLLLGGFDDEARVWLNGQPIGTSGRRFSKAAAFDLTESVKYDVENTLVIQVVRNSAANELGTGGLIRPSFVFAGPRLATKAPKEIEQRRVLPGGAEGEVEGR
ncbi:MAG TPA: DUF4838 domain-containing protein [Tepidisphaeraceae bacterium]|nr:DUF4838 domain-containing protein [Tepidisphaeraceae bacterium]